jgi:hypothetical protein
MKLGNIALCITLAEFKKRIELFGTQGRRDIVVHSTNMWPWCLVVSRRIVKPPILCNFETIFENRYCAR